MLSAFITGLMHALYFEHTTTTSLANPFPAAACAVNRRALLWLLVLFLVHKAQRMQRLPLEQSLSRAGDGCDTRPAQARSGAAGVHAPWLCPRHMRPLTHYLGQQDAPSAFRERSRAAGSGAALVRWASGSQAEGGVCPACSPEPR